MAKRERSPDDVEDVEDLLGQAIDSTDIVQLLRWDPSQGTWSYVERFDPAALRALGIRENVRARFGGGKFKARIRHANNTWGQSRVFLLDGEYRRPTEAPTTTAAAPVSTASTLEKILLPIALTFAGAIGTAAAKKLLDGPQVDPLALQLLKQFGGQSGMDPLELQRAIAEAEKRGEDRGRELGKLQQQVTHPREGSSKPLGASVVDAIDRNVPKLVGLLSRKMDLDQQARLQPAADVPAAEQPTEPAQVSTDPLIAMLESVPKVARAFLLSAAESGEQPEVYAGLVLSKLDDVSYANMAGFLERADFVDVFCATYPAFADHREWVTALAAAMKESLIAAAEADDDDETTSTTEPAANAGD